MARIIKYSRSIFRFLVQEWINTDPNGIEAMACNVIERKTMARKSDRRQRNPFRF